MSAIISSFGDSAPFIAASGTSRRAVKMMVFMSAVTFLAEFQNPVGLFRADQRGAGIGVRGQHPVTPVVRELKVVIVYFKLQQRAP